MTRELFGLCEQCENWTIRSFVQASDVEVTVEVSSTEADDDDNDDVVDDVTAASVGSVTSESSKPTNSKLPLRMTGYHTAC